MNPQRKAKKPARIKGHIVPAFTAVKNGDGLTIRWREVPKYLELPIDNPDAMVEQIGRAMAWEAVKHLGISESRAWEALHEKYTKLARAALGSIGVPIKAKRAQNEATT
jgi:hypothetical protein